MTFIESYGKEIVSLLVPLVTWGLNSVFKAKSKLQFALPHQFTFLIQQPLFDDQGKQVSMSQTVKTSSFIVRNAGTKTASKVELVFNWKPMCLNIWPIRHFEEFVEPDGRNVLIFDSLAPSETLGVEVLSVNTDNPNLITVRSAECVGQSIAMNPQPVISRNTRIAATLLLSLGLAATVYIATFLVQFLVLKTPLGR